MRSTARSSILLALAMALVIVCSSISRAGDVLSMKGEYEGPDSRLVNALFMITIERVDRTLLEYTFVDTLSKMFKKYYPDILNASAAYQHLTQVAYVDVNGDGRDEILVRFPFGIFCAPGHPGCTTYVLEKRENKWVPIGEALLQYIVIQDERVGGYRTLTSAARGLRWNVSQDSYIEFCIDRGTGIEEDGRCLDDKDNN